MPLMSSLRLAVLLTMSLMIIGAFADSPPASRQVVDRSKGVLKADAERKYVSFGVTPNDGSEAGMTAESNKAAPVQSDDSQWVSRTAAAENAWTSVTYGDGLFVAVASGGTTNRVMTSTDGMTWTARSAAVDNQWQSVTYGNGVFVAVANGGSDGTNRVMTSVDGMTWTARNAAEDNQWLSVTYANGLFVAVANNGTNRVMTSADGINWTARSIAEDNTWQSITYANGLFVAVANSGANRVMTSADGINWTVRSAAEDNQWLSVTYGNGLFVAVAIGGINRVMTSADGVTWTAHSAAEDNQWRSVTYANGLFVAVAGNGTNRVMTSIDGMTWTARSAAEDNQWRSVTYGNGLFVAVAGNGTNRVMTLANSNNVPVASGLNAGDIAIIRYNARGDKEFSFVVLADIPAGEEIHFTDQGWNGTGFTGLNTTVETVLTITTTNAIAAGTVLHVNGTTITPSTGLTVSGTKLDFSPTGDQLLVYQGSPDSPKFITALMCDYQLNRRTAGNPWDNVGVDAANSSSLPLGLINGVNCVSLATGDASSNWPYLPEQDNAIYDCVLTTGTKAQLLAAIYGYELVNEFVSVNWSFSDGASSTPFSANEVCASFTVLPDNQTNNPPTATNVTFTGNLEIGSTLTADYDYDDADQDGEGESGFQWYRYDTTTGDDGKTTIVGATETTYILTAADEGKYITFEVTPHDGTQAGAAVESERQGPVAAAVSDTQPAVTTTAATTITATSATLGGAVTANGGAEVTARGIEYSTTLGFTPGTGTAVPATTAGTGAFNVELTALSAATTYYYRAYATNSEGTAHGDEISFTTLSGTGGERRLYFTTAAGSETSDILWSADLDGNNLVELAKGAANFEQPKGVAVDKANGYVYVTDNHATSGKGIIRYKLDGSDRTVLVSPTNNSTYAGIALDLVNNKLYYTQTSVTASLDAVKSASLDGSNITTLVADADNSNFYNPTDIALDVYGGYMYVVDNHATTSRGIIRYKLDGTDRTVVIAPTSEAAPNGIALDLVNRKMYYTEGSNTAWLDALKRADLDGANGETLVSDASNTNFTQPGDVALDIENSHIYVTDAHSSSSKGIIRYDLDGNNRTVIADPLTVQFNGIALDNEYSTVTVTTSAADDVTAISAGLGGEVLANGGAVIVERGIEYSVTENFVGGTGTKVATPEAIGGVFDVEVTGLQPGTTYYFRSYAVNSAGMAFGGAQESFTTESSNILFDFEEASASYSGWDTKTLTVSQGNGVPDFSLTTIASPISKASLLGFSFSGAEGLYFGEPAPESQVTLSVATGYGFDLKKINISHQSVITEGNAAAYILSTNKGSITVYVPMGEAGQLTLIDLSAHPDASYFEGISSVVIKPQDAAGTFFELDNIEIANVTAMLAPITPDANGIVYVNQNVAGGNGSGQTWNDASPELAHVLMAANTNTDIKEIWVAAGTYKPMYRIDNLSDADPLDRWNTFMMVSNVKVYGGFAGTENAFEDRGLGNLLYETILSGDLAGDDTENMEANRADNAYKVVVFAGNVGTAVLDGFTVKGGKAVGSTTGLNGVNGQHIGAEGAGIYIKGASPTITNMVLTGNDARTVSGGGIWITTSAAVLDNVKSNGNQAGFGGGIYTQNFSGSISNSEFSNNIGDTGGGMYNVTFTGTVSSTTISGNTTGGSGGGVANSGLGGASTGTFTDVTISNNTVNGSFGGGMANDASPVTLNKVRITGNTANRGAGIFNWNSAINLTNARIENNSTNINNDNARGAGIFNAAASNGTFKNVLISGNVSRGSGTGVWVENSSPKLINVTISGNQSNLFNGVGGLDNNTGAGTIIQNTIISGNNYLNGVNLFASNLKHQGPDMSTVSYSLIGNNDGETGAAWKVTFGTDGGNNIVGEDPKFADAANGTYTLSNASPALNAGSNALFAGLDADTKDLAGYDRVYNAGNGGTIDLGAYEYQGEPSPFAGGEGTADAPYEIENVDQLQAMKDYLDNHFILIADIDASETATWNAGAGFQPIGNLSQQFKGTLKGNGKKITGLVINRPSTGYVGLFGAISNTATLTGIALEGIDIKGQSSVGGLVGYNSGGKIRSSYAKGAVSGTSYNVGGLVGMNVSLAGLISESYAEVTVSGTINNVGGLVGYNDNSNIEKSYARGKVSGVDNIGGLVGYNVGRVTESYAAGGVTGTGDNVGGLLGNYHSGTLTSNYWNTATSGQAKGAGNAPAATGINPIGEAGFRKAVSFVGFDFEETWSIEEGEGYPYLQSNPQVPVPFPIALAVTFSGDLVVGTTLTGNYTLKHADAAESVFKWYRYDASIGDDGKHAIDHATELYYTLTAADEGKYITFEVTPHDDTEAGTAVESERFGPIEIEATPTNGILYVKKDASGNGSGDSWANAMPELADALKWADRHKDDWSETNVLQIWVASGTYTPAYKAGNGTTDGDRAFVLVDHVELYGGFTGNEMAVESRTLGVAGNTSLLSADFNGDDQGFTNNGENAYHVVVSSGNDRSAVLDGFTISGSNTTLSTDILVNGNQVFQCSGGGIYLSVSSPILRNLTITGNYVGESGGGIFGYESSPLLSNVTLRGNLARHGGGMANQSNSSPELRNVWIVENGATESGGGLYNVNTSNPTIVNVIINGNNAGMNGGGIANEDNSSPTLTNVTISDNVAGAVGGGIANDGSIPVIKNSIIWGNGESNFDGGINPSSSHSIIEGLVDYQPDTDPLFTDTTNGDYTLQEMSPAIDAGSNDAYTDAGGNLETDLDLVGAARLRWGVIDMGAYERQQAPAPRLAAPADSVYRIGDELVFVVEFPAAVMTTGKPVLAIVMGGEDKNAVYTGLLEDVGKATFGYTITEGDSDSNGIQLTGTIDGSNGEFSFVDSGLGLVDLAYGTPLDLTGVRVDGIRPVLTAVSILSTNMTSTVARPGDSVIVALAASEPIGIPSVTVFGTSASVSRVSEGSDSSWTAVYVLTGEETAGEVPFEISGIADVAGNTSTEVSESTDASAVVFYKSAPVVTGVEDGATYIEPVTPLFTEGTATLNDEPFTAGDEVAEEGEYVLVITDAAGNSDTIRFEIDMTAPVVTGVEDGVTYTEPVTPLFTEGTATLNDEPFTSGTEIAEEGDYVLIVTDAAGNSDTIRFEIDMTAPVVTGVSDGSVYTAPVTPVFTEGTATLNDEPFTSDSEIAEEGDYVLIVTDAAGNSDTIRFEIDMTAPVVTGVEEGRAYNRAVTPEFNEGTAILNDEPFTSGTEVSVESAYTLIVTDAAGNSDTVRFEVDYTPPVVTGVEHGGIYNHPVTPVFTEGQASLTGPPFISGTTIDGEGKHRLVITDRAGNSDTIRFEIDMTAPVVTGVEEGRAYNRAVTPEFNEGTAILNDEPFTSGTEVSVESAYTLIVTDAAGNSDTVRFEVDYTPPVVTGVEHGGIYNHPVTPVFTEGQASLTGPPFISGTTIDGEGKHRLVITDRAGNSDTIRFEIDMTAPVVTGVEEGRAYNKAVTPEFNEGTALLNGEAFTSGTEVSVESAYTLIVTDAAGNSDTVRFEVDYTPPVVTGVEEGRAYNRAVTPEFNEGTALLNGEPFTSGTEVSVESAYTLIVTDAAGNSDTVRFEVDYTPPVVTGVEDGATYIEPVTPLFTEGTATLNDEPFTSSTEIAEEGEYVLIITDAVGNSDTIRFEIDTTAPVVTGAEDGATYTEPVTPLFTEGTATLNDEPFTSGTEIAEEGDYVLIITDAAGNSDTIRFVIDMTAPVVTGVEDGATYTEPVTPLFTEGTATLNDEPFTSGTEITEEGEYVLIITDAVGNGDTIRFEIDTTAPVVTGVEDGATYTEPVTPLFTEGTATLNDEPFTSGTEIAEEGEYVLIITDAVGNSDTIRFEIDTTAPVVTGVEDGATYTEPVTPVFTEGTATLNGEPFTSGTEIIEEGEYTLIIKDAAGNTDTIRFVIDMTAPEVTGVGDGAVYTEPVTPVFTEGTATLNGEPFTSGTEISGEGEYTLVIKDAAGNTDTIRFVIDMTAPEVTGVEDGAVYTEPVTPVFTEGIATLNGEPFTSGTEITEEGEYTLIIKDDVGNTDTIRFVIDMTAPVVTGVEDDVTYTGPVTPVFTEGTATLNGEPFTSGTEISGEGEYTLVIKDDVGNTDTIRFVIDMTAPEVTGVGDGAVYTGPVTPVFTEGTATLNGEPFTSGTEISGEGEYTLIIKDAAGNTDTIRFVLDMTAPVVTGVEDGVTYTEPVTPVFTEGTATLNGEPFTSGTEITEEGEYTLIIKDAAGNTDTIRFVIDMTAPEVTGVGDGAVYTGPVTPVFTEGTATLNGEPFTSGTEISGEGEYTLIIKDDVGNTDTIRFVIDMTAPEVTGVGDGAVYTEPVTPEFTEGTATLNGEPFTSGTEISGEGEYTLIIKDAAGNTNTIRFVIDMTAPEVTGVGDGAVYTEPVTPEFTEGIATLNGELFTSGTEIAGEGEYTLVIKDDVGNTDTIRFVIDLTAPEVTGVEDDVTYTGPVTPVFTEGTATLNGEPFTSGTEISGEGEYTLVIKDAAGNTDTIRFVIDLTAPVVTGVEDGVTYTEPVTPVFTEGTATLNGELFTSGTEISGEGEYTLIIKDDVGNTDTIRFVIDMTAPVVTGVEDGAVYTEPVTPVFTEGTATLNGELFTSGTEIAGEGEYTLVLTDGAGNATTVHFTIDRTAPAVTGVTDGNTYNTSVTPVFTEGTATLNGEPFTSGTEIAGEGDYTLTVKDAAGNETVVRFVIDHSGVVIGGVIDGFVYNRDVTPVFTEGTATLNGEPFTSGTAVTAEGEYTLVLTDGAGNATTVRFTIDRTAPAVTGVTDGNTYNTSITPVFTEGTATLNGEPFTSGTEIAGEGDYTLTVKDAAGNETVVRFVIDHSGVVIGGVIDGFVYNRDVTPVFNEGTATLNGEPFISGTAITEEGEYTLVLTDGAGNATTVHFTIDRTAPAVTGVTDGNTYNTSVTPVFTEGTATLNGEPFTSGTEIAGEGDYTLTVKDAAGNETVVRFVIDHSGVVIGGVIDGFVYNRDVTPVFTEGTATLNGEPFTSGTAVTAEGEYTLVLTDRAGNATTVHFTIDRTAPAVTGVTDGNTYNTSVIPVFTEGTATLNGEPFTSGTAVTAEGEYTLVLTDAAGNATTVHFTIDRTAPAVTGVTDGNTYNTPVTPVFTDGTATLNGAPFTSGTEIAGEGDYTLTVKDAAGNETVVRFVIDHSGVVIGGVIDGFVYNRDVTPVFNEGTATLNGEPFTSGTAVTAEGEYTLVLTDAAGNATTVRFTIDRTAPAVTGVTDGNTYNTSVTPVFTEGTATLNGEPFTSGTEIAGEGDYTLTVKDAAGNETVVRFVIDHSGVVIGGVIDGFVYNRDVTPVFNEGTATLNGEPFTSGTAITEEGEYTLVLTDGAGNATTVHFTIDRTAPAVTGVTDGNTYNTSVTPVFTDGTATLNGESFTSGTAISEEGDYMLEIVDAAGNKTLITFVIDLTAPSVTGVSDGAIYNVPVTPVFTEGTATLNGEPFTSGTEIAGEGDYTLTVKDAAGNETVVRFVIDHSGVAVGGVIDGFVYNRDVTPVFNEGTATLNGEPFTSGTAVTAEGEYTLVLTDGAGNATTVRFTIDRTAPAVTGATDGNTYNTSVTPVFTEGTATLNGAPFTSGTEIAGEGDYTLTVKDAAGNETVVRFVIDHSGVVIGGVIDGFVYNRDVTPVFNEGTATLNGELFISGTAIIEEGEYTLVLTDGAGNATTVHFTIDKTAPVVTGAEDGAVYGSPVTPVFTEGTATLNGEPFTAGAEITSEGDYTLIVKDDAGNETVVSFTIGELPGRPTGLSGSPGNKYVTLDWQAPPAATLPITNYIIEYSGDGGSTWTTADHAPLTGNRVVVIGLDNNRSYRFRIAAVNTLGAGTFSPELVGIIPTEPVPDAEGELPQPEPGETVVITDGKVEAVVLEVVDGEYLRLRGDGYAMELASLGINGERIPISAIDAIIRLIRGSGAGVYVSGSGFEPGTVVTVYLFSVPELVGHLPVGSDGRFAGTLPVPTHLEVGNHTLQANGIVAGGLGERSVSVGLQLVDNKPQQIAFEVPEDLVYGSVPVELQATASSGLPVSYAVTDVNGSATDVASIAEGKVLRIHKAGAIRITASQSGNVEYASAVSVGHTVTIAKATLTVTAAAKEKVYGAVDPALTYTHSGLTAGDEAAVFNGSLTREPGETVGSYGIGRGDLTAGDNYMVVFTGSRLTITPAVRSLSFAALPAKTYGDSDFAPGAVASTGEVVSYTSGNPGVAVIESGRIRITGAGEVTITATVSENSNYTTRPEVSQTLVVDKATQTITVPAITELDREAGSVPLAVSSSSGLPVTLGVDDQQVAVLGGGMLNVLRLGTVTITATQEGNANYHAADPVRFTIRITDDSNFPVKVHRAVSPNGDGLNEFLMVEGIRDFPENRVTVINRNGTVLYEVSGYDNGYRAFRGISTGQQQLPAGTYYYIVEIKENGRWRSQQGYFVLRY